MENLENLEYMDTGTSKETDTKTGTAKFYQTGLVQDLVFTAIVILGMLGMVCAFGATVMSDIGIYDMSLNQAKASYYTSWANTTPFEIIDWVNNNFYLYGSPKDADEFFVDSNLVGLLHLDEYGNIVNSYGDTSGENAISFLRRDFKYNYDEEKGFVSDYWFYVEENPTYNDAFLLRNDIVELLYNNAANIWIIGIIIGFSIIALYVFLLKIAGYKKGCEGFHAWQLCRIPLEINFVIAMFLGFFACINSIENIWSFYRYIGYVEYLFYHLFFLAVAEIVFLALSMDIAIRVKTKTLAKTSIIGMFFKLLKDIPSQITVLWTYLLFYFALVLFCVITIAAFEYTLGLAFIIINLVVFPLFMYFILNFIKMIKASAKISAGDYDYKVEDQYLYLGFKDIADNLNNISAGMEDALQEKLKSELLKTELITNVSHDIKTPLTSIINYSDLICKEECDNSKIVEYSEVLHRQSNKLKKLIDDLIDASKVSSGNITVNLEEIELSVLIEQVIAEYNEKLAENNLELISNTDCDLYDLDEHFILADGKLLSRVFDNLFNNILKYSLEGTRVYFDVKVSKNLVTFTFKNTSKYQLNISQELLTERFIRGDLSRHSEGSGLGLSIAQNLVIAQSGEFEVSIDGDLFKAIVNIRLST